MSAGVDPTTGRYAWVIRTVRGTKRDACSALRQLEVEVANGQVGLEDPTVAALLERWLTHINDLGRSPATLYNYRRYVDREFVPVIGSLRLSKLTAGHLDRLYSALRRRGLAPATIRQIHAVMRAASASGCPVGPRVAECCVVGVCAVPTAAGATAADGRRGDGAHPRG